MIIDDHFQSLIPPLSAEEKAQLEENIKVEGCRDTLITWQGILLDGHNRFEICNRLNIPFRTMEIDLPEQARAPLTQGEIAGTLRVTLSGREIAKAYLVWEASADRAVLAERPVQNALCFLKNLGKEPLLEAFAQLNQPVFTGGS